MNAQSRSEHTVDPDQQEPLVRRRPLADSEMDITPMIDITFLLLIFFLVAARLQKDTQVQLPPARHGTTVSIKSSAILTLAKDDRDQAEVYLGDGKAADRLLPVNDLEAQENSIIGYIQEQLSSGKDNVLIKAESAVRHRDVARVSAAVGKAGRDLYVAVLEIQ